MLLIEQTAVASVVLLHIKGALRAPDSGRLPNAIQQAVRTGARRVVLDLERVTDLDAAGLGALIAARNLVGDVGGRIALVKPSRRVIHMLVVTRLLSFFDIGSDVPAGEPNAGAIGPAETVMSL